MTKRLLAIGAVVLAVDAAKAGPTPARWVVDETAHMGHLQGCLTDFCRAFFGIDDLPQNFLRPSEIAMFVGRHRVREHIAHRSDEMAFRRLSSRCRHRRTEG